MKTVFADAFYFFALLSKTDEAHTEAVEFTRSYRGAFVTTDWVMVELADGLSATPHGRAQFLQTRDRLAAHPRTKIVKLDDSLYQAGIALYAQRPDKEWSLTDCISFVVMQRERLTDALTGDHHFIQAGITALLK